MLKKEDVQEYVASLIAVLRLTQYLNFINEKVQTGQQQTIAVNSENEFNKQPPSSQPHSNQQYQQQNNEH